MHRFFELVVKPALDATDARRVVEIGALRGEMTERLLDQLGPDAELHVIDPVPKFDPTELQRRFAGRFLFHRDLSLRALPDIPAVDVALIDGDHNWYTVFHELGLLAARSREAGRPIPLLLMHDVGWPYGRRDLYYDPETIPAEYRHPYARLGIGRKRRLLETGGLNAGVNNALREHGPRNGVLTALEDFVAEHDRPLRIAILPAYFGLAVVAEKDWIEREPKLATFFERLESPETDRSLLELANSLWLRALHSQQQGSRMGDKGARIATEQRAAEAGAQRYLELLKTALLDQHYLENEVRVHYLALCAKRGQEPDQEVLRRPGVHLRRQVERAHAQRQTRSVEGDGNNTRAYFPYTTMGRVQLDQLSASLDVIRAEGVHGDLVECGTGRGGGAIFLRGYLDARGIPDTRVWVADAFRDPPEGRGSRHHPMTADINEVREGFARFGLLDGRVRFLAGRLPDVLQDAPIESVALLRLGDGLEVAPGQVLEALYAKVAIGGHVIVEDAGSVERRTSVEEFRDSHSIPETLQRIDAGAVTWQKLSHDEASGPAVPRAVGLDRAPVAPPLPTGANDLTVVVVFHDMRREAERTLHSLTRAYQQGVEELDYEVIAVENGSAPEQELGADFVESFGAEFRYLNLAEDAHPSPARALNRGIAAARGRHLALMIDGAHVLSPGVLRHGMTGLATYTPAVVATQQFHVGPSVQYAAIREGYDRAYEERLFRAIGWPSRGYELFDISHFARDRDWFEGIVESNCLFTPRALLEQAGGLDESFDTPGGAFANLDIFERLVATPGVTLVTILGEGSFHQAHGGSTTNVSDDVEHRRRKAGYRASYMEVRGRRFRPPGRPMHYVGQLRHEALRTKPRWRKLRNLAASGADGGGPPDTPVLIAEELRQQFTAAYWHSLYWRATTWDGAAIGRSPADLVAYQELVARLRPAWVVVAGAEDERLPGFFANFVEHVLAVGEAAIEDAHPHVRPLAGAPESADIAEAARREVEDAQALVVLARATKPEALARFDAYAPLVPVGGYVVVEDTVVNGNPVWPEHGPGPMEAVSDILRDDLRFTADRQMERYGPSFNPKGYLRRVAR